MLACLLAAVLCSTPAVAAKAQVPTQSEFSVAINVAGRQRMYSQKMTKEFLLVALDVESEQNRKNAAATIALFEENHKLLIAGDAERGLPPPPSDAIKKQLDSVGKQWSELRARLEGNLGAAPKADALAQVQQASNAVLDEMIKAVALYEDACKAAGFASSGTVVNVAGRQRMLSQKMSKEVCLIALGVDVEGNREALKKSQALFARSHKGLIEGDAELGLPAAKSDSIKRQLTKVDGLWQPFSSLVDGALAADAISPNVLAQVAELNPQILNEMNKAVTMFEAATAN